MLIPRRTVRTSQPQSAAGIDWENPLTKDLVAAFNFSSFPALIDSVSGRIAENQGVIRASGPSGVGIAASTAGIRIPWSLGFTTEDISITVVEYRTAVPSSYWMICDNRESGAGYAYGFVDTIFNPGGTLTVPGWKVTTYCKNEFYQNNVKTSAAIGTLLIPSVGVRFLGRYTDSDPYNNSVIYGLIVHKRNISQREHAALLDNPWQIFEDEEEYRFIPAAGGGSTLNAAATGGAVAGGSASLATQVALAGIGVAVAGGSASAAASIPLSAAGLSVAGGAANAQATITLSAADLAQAAGQAGLSASVLLAGAGAAAASGNAALSAQLNALATGAAQASGSANLTGGAPGALSATGQAQADGSAVLSVSISLAATGAVQASGTATGTASAPGALSAAGGAQADGAATWSTLITLTAAGFVQAMGAGAFSAQVPLSASGQASAGGQAGASLAGLVHHFRLGATVARLTALSHGVRRTTTLHHEVRHA